MSDDNKKFRINAQTFALTYPKCPLTKERVQKFIKNKHPYDHIATCEEKHKDGTPHLHVYVRFQKKLNIKDEKHFDIHKTVDNIELYRYHPNIQGCRNSKQWYEYVLKGGNYIQNFDWDFLSPKDFLKRKNDFEAFKMHLYKISLSQCPKEITLNETLFKNEGKKRHICLITDPNWGKTQWIEDTFEGKSIFKANNGKYPLDDYDGEEIIIFDDYIPKCNLLLNISNVYKTLTPVGDTRYHTKYWPLKQQRWIILLLNTPPDYTIRDNIIARFNIIDLRKDKLTVIDACTTLDGILPTSY